MARGRSTGVLRAALVLLVVLALVCTGSLSDAKKSKKDVVSGSDKVAELNGRVRDGVVPLTTELFEKYVLRPDRPYHLFLLFTATADKYACDVCKQVSPEFLVLGESYTTAKQVKVDTRDGMDIFYGVVDFDVNQAVFGIYGFTSAPHIVYVAPDRSDDTGKKSPTKVKVEDANLYNVYSGGKKAENINAFVKQKTGFDFVIQRSKAFLYALVAAALVVFAVAAKIVLSNLDKLLVKLRRKRLWMTVSLLFYGLSVSGMVYCIIREPPAYTTERNGKIKFFHPQGRSQFVVEGLIIGAYDVAAAGFMILLSQWAIYLQRPVLRYAAIAICALGFVFMYREMIACYTFKNRWYTGWMGF